MVGSYSLGNCLALSNEAEDYHPSIPFRGFTQAMLLRICSRTWDKSVHSSTVQLPAGNHAMSAGSTMNKYTEVYSSIHLMEEYKAN